MRSILYAGLYAGLTTVVLAPLAGAESIPYRTPPQAIVARDYAVLRQFRGNSSLAGYLTVVARRICVHELAEHAALREQPKSDRLPPDIEDEEPTKAGHENVEEVLMLLRKLPARERDVVRLFYLEGRSYEEISTELNIPVNSIGPVLARARKKMREGPAGSPHIQPGRDQ